MNILETQKILKIKNVYLLLKLFENCHMGLNRINVSN